MFLVSTVLQFRFGKRERSFNMRRWIFLPVAFVVSLVSGIIGEAGPVLNPFYLNYGVEKESMIGTKSVNSIAMQATKIASYFAFGALMKQFLIYGLVIGLAAASASWTGKRILGRMEGKRFRQFVVALMVFTGLLMLWQERDVLLGRM